MGGKRLLQQKGLLFFFALLIFSFIGISQVPLISSAGRPSPPTPTPFSLLESLESIIIMRRYPLEVEGKVLEDNPWREYYAPEFSPDGKWMLFRKQVIGGRELWITDSQGRNASKLLERVWDYAWSPDGKWIAYTQSLPKPQKGASLWVMKSDGTGKRKLAEPLKTGQVEWTKDGRLVYMGFDGYIKSVSLDGIKFNLLFPPEGANLFALSPQGDRIALAVGGEAWIVNLKKPRELKKIVPYTGAFWGWFAWSPDGSKLAFSSRYSIFLLDKDGDLIAEVHSAWEPWNLAWSPDGKILAFIARTEERGLSYEIFFLDPETKMVKQLTDDREGDIAPGGLKNSLTWSPDGNRLLYGTSRLPGQKVQVIEISRQGPNTSKPEKPFPRQGGENVIPFVLTPPGVHTPASSDCPYQEGNDGTIWIFRERYCPPEISPEECVQQIPFEVGVYQHDPSWSNYLGGVLEGEIGGTAETSLQGWQPEMARAFSIAARTVALYWCPHSIVTDTNGITHYGLNDWQYQVYRPGWSSARAEEYRSFVADTEGRYLTYNGNVFDLQYRKYVGQQTYNRDPNGPHKGIFDPVSSQNEHSSSGMGVHSANHWIEGRHNAVGCEDGAEMGCDGTPIAQWEPNFRWEDYRQILVHYYTGVHLVDNQGNTLTPSDRWNLLNHTVPTTVTAGSVFTPSLMLQNTSTWDWWEEAIVLGYQWTPPNASPLPGEWIEALWLPSLQMGDSITVAVPIEVSEQAGSYHLHIDLGKGIAPASARGVMEIDSSWFHEGGWPHAVIPVTVEGVAPTPTPSPTPTSTPTPTPTRTPTPTPQPTPTPGWRWWGTAEKAALKERPIEEQEAYSRLLSRIRDEVMAPDPKGEAYIRLVYWYAPEIAGLLLEDRALREEVAVLMDEARPLLEEMLEGEGGHTRLSESWVRRAQAVLDKVEGKASPELRGEIRWWRGWLPRFVGKTGWEIWRMLPEREVKLGVGRTPEEVVLRGLSAQEIWAYGQLLSRIRDEVMLRSPGERDGGLAGDG